MRKIYEIDVMIAEANELRRAAEDAGRQEEAVYYEGVILALTWTKDKGGEKTHIWYGEAPAWAR